MWGENGRGTTHEENVNKQVSTAPPLQEDTERREEDSEARVAKGERPVGLRRSNRDVHDLCGKE